jgi:anti-sigma factor (TIGR02949 family)
MNPLTFNSEQCARARRHLDAYLSNELQVETTGEVLRHLETCESCTRELQARTRLRDALRRAVANQAPPPALQATLERKLRKRQPGWYAGVPRMAWAAAFILLLVVGGMVAHEWISIVRGRRVVEGVMAIGVSDHVLCAIRGHNYPEVAKPPAQLRRQLGPQYSGLLAVVQAKLPGFEVLEAHICLLPGSPRKYVHFITRGRGTILSVILTRSDGARLPAGWAFTSGASGGVQLYAAHLQGMNAAGFESNGYLGFVVSDLGPATILQLAKTLAPGLRTALEESNPAGLAS